MERENGLAYASEEVQRVLRRGGRRSIRSVLARQVIRAFFARYELADPVLDAVAAKASRVHMLKRGDECFQLDERRIYLLVNGCVREELHGVPATARIWGRGTLFGDWTGQFHRSSGTVLSQQARGVSLGVEDVRRIGRSHPELFLALGAATQRRLHLTDAIYGASGRTVSWRVTELLWYLASEDGGTHVEGPTQADIADALGVSRAAVENAIAGLRRSGILGRARRVRFYEIERPAPGPMTDDGKGLF
ncbi:Crp/Fnr family transcriptional regulator [Streptomyces luteogriseus]|uniref:Crp/Fnr family transcriptional regulator n=1 Tax=Streptomyces luteogriseus TaxID=68233 RepID=UPI0033F208AF